jgi:hypothetical protein
MGNKGAFIVLEGKHMRPQYTTYEAVVSSLPTFMETITVNMSETWSYKFIAIPLYDMNVTVHRMMFLKPGIYSHTL